jgi:hypothetical protein
VEAAFTCFLRSPTPFVLTRPNQLQTLYDAIQVGYLAGVADPRYRLGRSV